MHLERLEEGRVIYQYRAATRGTLYYAENAVEPSSMAAVILIRRLLDVQERGWNALHGLASWREGPVKLEARNGYPGSWTLIRFLLLYLQDRIRQKAASWRGDPKWFVCLRRNRDLFTSVQSRFLPDGFVAIPNPDGSTFADPFVLGHNGQNYLFVEEIVTSTDTAHLSACEILSNGPGRFFEVLRRPYHISYPSLIQHDGNVYLLPETAANRTVELYRALEFPRRWQLEKVLQRGILLVDTTPFFHQGVWYFFTATVEEVSGNWLETWLFYSGSLDGEWTYHPRNPVCSDARRARPAGHLFYRNGKLIRPAQDCSIRYGYAIALNEVLKLSPDEYEERLAEVIPPDWMPGIFATHTLNSCQDVEVIDATRISGS